MRIATGLFLIFWKAGRLAHDPLRNGAKPLAMKPHSLPLLGLLALLPFASVRADIPTGFTLGTTATTFTGSNGQSSNGLSVSGNVATLTTNSGTQEGNALFYNTKQSIAAFKVSFTYQDVGGSGASSTADGFTFTLQNDSRNAGAVGGTGNSLGYAVGGGTTTHTAIVSSAAVGFDIYGGSTTGLVTTSSLGVMTSYKNSTPTTVTSLTSGLVNTSNAILYSGDPINVQLTYNGTTLSETLTDANNSTNTSTFSYTVNLANVLGASTAYVGFTGADGATTSTQTIGNFSYTVVPEPSTWLGGGLLTTLAGGAVVRRRFGRPARLE